MSDDDKPRGPRRLQFPPRTPSAEQRILQLAKQLAEERTAAREKVDRLLDATPRARWPELAENDELLTAGALERLGNLCAEWFGRDPVHAVALAELAVAVAGAIPEDAYPAIVRAQCLAHAWKDLGKAYRGVNRYQESIDALTRAETHLRDHGALGHDLAIVRLDLAVTFQEVGRYDEALLLMREARDVFRLHTDTRRLTICGIAEGVLLQRLQHYREARETYLLLLASTKKIEPESLAALHLAVGFCSIELQDYGSAEASLDEAEDLYRRLGKPVEALKVELGRGRLYIRRGDHRLAIIQLEPVRRKFRSLSMPEEAGLCGLEIVEALLHLSDWAHAETLAKKLVWEFTAARLSTRAISALGYLREAIASRNVSVRLPTEVREYIVSLRTDPERDFRPARATDGGRSE